MSVQLRPFTIWNVFLVDQGLELDLDCQESMYCSVLDCFTGGSICASPFVSFIECFKGSLSLCMLGMNDGFELLNLLVILIKPTSVLSGGGTEFLHRDHFLWISGLNVL